MQKIITCLYLLGPPNKGLKELDKIAHKTGNLLSGYDLFKLQDTYGFPLELSIEECYRKDIKLTENYREEFEKALKDVAACRGWSAGHVKSRLKNQLPITKWLWPPKKRQPWS